MDKIEELEEKALELEDKALKLAQEIAKLKKGQNAGEWKPEKGEMYWYMNFDGEPDNLYFDSPHSCDIWRVKNIPVFKTKEECQKYCDYRKALSDKRYNFSREEWKSTDVFKYSILYGYTHDYGNKILNIMRSRGSSQYLGEINFKTEEDAQYMIDNYSEEILKWGLM